MIDLGIMPKKSEPCEMPCSTSENKKDEPCYPGLRLSDENVDKFKKEAGECKNGDEYYAYVKLKVTGTADQKYDKSITFDVLEISEIESEEEDAEEKTEEPSRYKNPATAKVLKK